MSPGFYELLQVSVDATPEAIRAAWQEQVALLMRKARATEARQQDLAMVEARRQALSEAYAVLSSPARRRRYDRFRELSRMGLPTDPEELWKEASSSLVDPAVAAALEVLRMLTDLKVGDPFGGREVTIPGERRPTDLRLPPEAREERAIEPRGEGTDRADRRVEADPREGREAQGGRDAGRDLRDGREGRDPRSEGRDLRSEGRDPRSEGRDPRSEGRDPRSEGRDPRSEGRVRADGRDPRLADPRLVDPRADGRSPEARLADARARIAELRMDVPGRPPREPDLRDPRVAEPRPVERTAPEPRSADPRAADPRSEPPRIGSGDAMDDVVEVQPRGRPAIDLLREEAPRAAGPEPRLGEPADPRLRGPRLADPRSVEPRLADPRARLTPGPADPRTPDPRAWQPADPRARQAPRPAADPRAVDPRTRPPAPDPRPAAEARAPEPRPAEPPRIQMPPPAATRPPTVGTAPAPAPAPAPAAPARTRAPSPEEVAKVVDRAGTTGACLKAVRELRGLSLAELSTTTRISQRFLDALERDSYADLPAATFVRGYVKMVVRALQITGTGPELEQFIDGYMARFHRNRG